MLAPVPFDTAIVLPAGDYAFACRSGDGGVAFRRFTVRPGEESVVPRAE